jgi:flavodoxin short chain
MKKALIIYGSTTGNTEYVAEVVAKSLKQSKLDVTVKNVSDVSVQDINGDQDIVLFGCSTWGDDEIELQEDFAEFYEAMGNNGTSYEGMNFAVFGCGDSSYTYFCGAVDAIEEKVAGSGGEIVVDSLKIDGDPDPMKEEIQNWAESVNLALSY